jgi:hypothetical protein
MATSPSQYRTARRDVVTRRDAAEAARAAAPPRRRVGAQEADLQRIYSIGCYADAMLRLLNLYEGLEDAVRAGSDADVRWHLDRIEKKRRELRLDFILEDLPRNLEGLRRGR